MATTTPLRRGDVKLLRWPAESARRDRYKALGVLRLLVIEGDVPAPISSDVREDWVRAPVSGDDLRVRIAALRAKAESQWLPKLDPHGLLWFGGHSIMVSRTETDLLECLIRQFGRLAPRSTLFECLPSRPGGPSRNALDLHIMRIRRRIRPLGLVIRTVWGRGYVLEYTQIQPAIGGMPWIQPASSRAGAARRPSPGNDSGIGGSRRSASEVAALRWGRKRTG